MVAQHQATGAMHLSAERAIGAPTERVYGLISNYREGHPRILPPAFSNFVVEQGGVGAGTIIQFQVRAGGRTRKFRQRVEEPEPGRVLTESGIDSSEVTTFTVTPEGTGCRIRIDTTWQSASGIGGLFERWLAPRLLRPIYADELERLDHLITAGPPST